MSLYRQGDDQDYSAPVRWQPPPPRFNSGPSWEYGVGMFILALAVGILLWDKFVHRTTPEIPPPPSANVMMADSHHSPDLAPPPPTTSANEVRSTNEEPEEIELDTESSGGIQGRIEFYQSEEAQVVARVTSNVGYRLNWWIDPEVTYLHPANPVPEILTLSASGPVYPDDSSSDTQDGNDAVKLEVYSGRTGELVIWQWFDVWVMDPLYVSLPASARANTSDPLINQPVRIAPEIMWEGREIDLSVPPGGMDFNWVWQEDGSVLSTDPIYLLPSDFYRSGWLELTVSYQGFTGRSSTEINPPRSMSEMVRQ